MISHILRCIYVHVPKTAGNSVNRAMGVGWQDHKDLRRYQQEMPPAVFRGYYKFAIVRNPWERLLSDYNYQMKKSRPRDSKLFLFADSGAVRRFGEWVDAALSDPLRYEPASWGADVSPGMHRWSPQVDWIAIDGRVAVDTVVRMERLNSGFRKVCRDIGVDSARLPHRNRRFHWHYSWYYDRQTREKVAAYYAHDIEAFGYRFESSPDRRGWIHCQARAASLLLRFVHPASAQALSSLAAGFLPPEI